MSIMAFDYSVQLYRQGYFPLPPRDATIDALDVAFAGVHRPLFPYAGVSGVYIGLDTGKPAIVMYT